MPQPLYLCLHLCDFAAQSLTHRTTLHAQPVAVLSGAPPLETVFSLSPQARRLGAEPGMSRVQAASFGLTLRRRDRQREDTTFVELMQCAQRFSPRVEALASPQEERCGATLMLDLAGSERLFGTPEAIARQLAQRMAELQLLASIACSQRSSVALLAARGREGITVIAAGSESATLAPLPIAVLEPAPEHAQSLSEWGIRTLGQLAELPPRALAARMGEAGVLLQRQARGEHTPLLVPQAAPPDAPLTESIELEHPVEVLEPLLFLISQMLEALLRRAAERALVLAEVETVLVLDGPSTERGEDGARREHCRTVRPTLPERERLTLLKLIQLDLELHPPEAAVIALRMTAQPAPAQVAQHGLFAAQSPEGGRMEILLARLRKLVGEERVGAPELLDTHAPEDFRMSAFAMQSASAASHCEQAATRRAPLRMVRPPRALHVELRNQAPEALYCEGRRLRVVCASGPWRTDGGWWAPVAGAYQTSWSREEWDVVLDEQPRRCLRLAFDPGARCWYLIGTYD